jgi:hypothetical protein
VNSRRRFICLAHFLASLTNDGDSNFFLCHQSRSTILQQVATMAKGQAQLESSIHPLFSRNKFPADIDYDNVIQRPALLASRLLGSPQSLHYFHTTFFGKNTVVFRDDWGPKASDSNQESPQGYGSDKGVGELSSRDKTKVREQLHELSKKIRFGLADLGGASGQTEPEETQPGVLGVMSTIWLGAGLYGAAQDETRMLMDEDKAL